MSAPAGWLVDVEELGDGLQRRRYAYLDGTSREVVVPRFPTVPVSDAWLSAMARQVPPPLKKA